MPEAILAICFPLPNPTDAVSPVSASMRVRMFSANAVTSATDAPTNSAGSPKASSKESISMTGITSRTMENVRSLALRYTDTRGGNTTAPAPTSRRA